MSQIYERKSRYIFRTFEQLNNQSVLDSRNKTIYYQCLRMLNENEESQGKKLF